MKVSIHASAREATIFLLINEKSTVFQSTPPRGRRQDCTSWQDCDYCRFNPRLREGGDDLPFLYLHLSPEFQSTPPRGRRPVKPITQPVPACFNPRLREGGDFLPCCINSACVVSIHASAREATWSSWKGIIKMEDVSIHASAREATVFLRYAHVKVRIVSIHASAREATRNSLLLVSSHDLFQSTPPRGRRPLRPLSYHQ